MMTPVPLLSFGSRSCVVLSITVRASGVVVPEGAVIVAFHAPDFGSIIGFGYVRESSKLISFPFNRAIRLALLANNASGTGVASQSNFAEDSDVTIDLDGGGGSEIIGDPAQFSGNVSLKDKTGQVSPAARDIIALQVSATDTRVVGSSRSDPSDGSYLVNGLVGQDAKVYLMALDELGVVFDPAGEVGVDDLIHPTTSNGYVYRVVTAGELPATEPDWWTTGQQQVGTATLEAREYLRPLAHGPVDVTFL